MSVAFLYAGQGSQHAGMGADLYDANPVFRSVIDEAARCVPFDLKQMMFEDPEGLLSQTEYTQPCMVAFACGMTEVLREQGVIPAYVAGLSLGEYSALAASGVFESSQAVALAAFRGDAMRVAAAGRDTSMVSVLGLDREVVERVVAEVAHEAAEQVGASAEAEPATGEPAGAPFVPTVEVSNYNCPGQIVIAGDTAPVEQAVERLREAGARRCIPLNVSGPFHTSLLKPAGDALRERFASERFGSMQVPVLFNCLGREMEPAGSDTSNAAQIAQLLERQVQSAVRMEDIIHRLAELGVDTVVEIGPGRVLSGLVRKTEPGMARYEVETVADVDKVVAALGTEEVAR